MRFDFVQTANAATTTPSAAGPPRPLPRPLPRAPPPRGRPSQKVWGEPVWTWLHVLAERVDAGAYDTQPACRREVQAWVRGCLAHLPCPECALHASAYWRRAYPADDDAPTTREALRRALWAFHNDVNARLGAPPFPEDGLGARYGALPLDAATQRAVFYLRGKYAVRNAVLEPGAFARHRYAAGLLRSAAAAGGRPWFTPPPAVAT